MKLYLFKLLAGRTCLDSQMNKPSDWPHRKCYPVNLSSEMSNKDITNHCILFCFSKIFFASIAIFMKQELDTIFDDLDYANLLLVLALFPYLHLHSFILASGLVERRLSHRRWRIFFIDGLSLLSFWVHILIMWMIQLNSSDWYVFNKQGSIILSHSDSSQIYFWAQSTRLILLWTACLPVISSKRSTP